MDWTYPEAGVGKTWGRGRTRNWQVVSDRPVDTGVVKNYFHKKRKNTPVTLPHLDVP